LFITFIFLVDCVYYVCFYYVCFSCLLRLFTQSPTAGGASSARAAAHLAVPLAGPGPAVEITKREQKVVTAYERKLQRQREQYALTKAAAGVVGKGENLDERLAALVDASRRAGTAGQAALKQVIPQATAALETLKASVKEQLERKIAILSAQLPDRSRFRRTIVNELSEGESDAWVNKVFGVGTNYRRQSAARTATAPLYDERLAGPPASHRETTHPIEVTGLCAFSKTKMVVKSGTRYETFKLELQKQVLLQEVDSSQPRRLRLLYAADASVRADQNTVNLTILQRNLEHAL
jgi:hypothetical protein